MGREVSSEAWVCCGLVDSSLMVVVAWPFGLSEVSCGSIGVSVPSWTIASVGEEADGMSFSVSWDEGGGGTTTDRSLAIASARFVGHREFLIWSGELASKVRQSSTNWV